jgi:hypothetical protein
MRWQVVNPKVLELQTAKEILAEVFHARPGEVEEMIQRRLGEMSWETERAHQAEDGLWPAMSYVEG